MTDVINCQLSVRVYSYMFQRYIMYKPETLNPSTIFPKAPTSRVPYARFLPRLRPIKRQIICKPYFAKFVIIV